MAEHELIRLRALGWTQADFCASAEENCCKQGESEVTCKPKDSELSWTLTKSSQQEPAGSTTEFLHRTKTPAAEFPDSRR